MINHYWLVVDLPVWKIWVRQMGLFPNWMEKWILMYRDLLSNRPMITQMLANTRAHCNSNSVSGKVSHQCLESWTGGFSKEWVTIPFKTDMTFHNSWVQQTFTSWVHILLPEETGIFTVKPPLKLWWWKYDHQLIRSTPACVAYTRLATRLLRFWIKHRENHVTK